MVEAFLNSILKGTNEIGWSSSKKIAEYTNWALEEVEKALKQLADEGKILCRKKGRGHQYGPLVPIEKQTSANNKQVIFEPVIQEAPPENTVFSSIDDFMLRGILAIPRDQSFGAESFAIEMIKAYPNVEWSKEEVVQKIAMLVRLDRLDLRPFIEDSRMKYEYAIK